MGWDTQTTTRTTEAVIRQTFENGGNTVTHYASRGRAAYVAVREPDGTTTAAVVLVERSGGSLGMKIMHESEGPYYHDAPAELLDALTPTDAGYAPQWRARCRAAIADRDEMRRDSKRRLEISGWAVS